MKHNFPYYPPPVEPCRIHYPSGSHVQAVHWPSRQRPDIIDPPRIIERFARPRR